MKTLVLLVLSLLIFNAEAQQPAGANEFSLQSAIEYALKHNAGYLNAEADAEYNRYKKNEVLAAGMPQINGSFGVNDNQILPTSLIPAQFFGGKPGTFAPVKFGVQYNATAGGSVSQLLFSSDYLVGVMAAKEVVKLSQKNILRSKAETAQNVSKAYYGVLVNRERIKILELNIDRVKLLRDNVEALNKNGFSERIDLDRLEVSYNNLTTEKEKTMRLAELSEALLKFQMGYEISAPIILTDKLDAAAGDNPEILMLNEKPDLSQRPEYLVMEAQQKLNEYDLRRYRLQYLPTLMATGSYSQMFQKNQLDFNRNNWYPMAIFGATLNLPIFDGLAKNARVQQAKVNLLKTQNNFNQLKLSMEFEVQSAIANYKNAAASLQVQKKNIELANRIFTTVQKKYEQGLGSGLELNTAENDLRQAQTNYYNALFDLIVAKIDYLKSSGTLVK